MSNNDSPHADLTRRERELLLALLQDHSVRSAAESIGMAEGTARVHMRDLHRKTATHTIGGLLGWGLDHASCCLDNRTENS